MAFYRKYISVFDPGYIYFSFVHFYLLFDHNFYNTSFIYNININTDMFCVRITLNEEFMM